MSNLMEGIDSKGLVRQAFGAALASNCSYAKHVFTDLTFAIEEFGKAGIRLSAEQFKVVMSGYETLRNGLGIVAKANNKRIHTIIPINF